MEDMISKLRSIDLSKPERTVKYSIKHNNGETTVDQDLILIRHSDGTWSANMEFDGFPNQVTAQDAAMKLSDWMDRLSRSIKNGNFHTINLETDIGR